MKRYCIKADYITGNSYSQETIKDYQIELTWDNLDIAKENLQRIKEHHKFYRRLHNWDTRSETKDKILLSAIDKPWFADNGVKDKYGYMDIYEYVVILKTDEGEDYQYHVPWNGYFESLQRARIELVQPEIDSDMEISFNDYL